MKTCSMFLIGLIGAAALLAMAPPQVRYRDDCEYYYDHAQRYAGNTLGSRALVPYGHPDIEKMQAYATMYLACRERNR